MFGLDDWISSFSDGTTLLIIVVVAVLLGLRHATDPDHLAAVTALLAGKKDRGTRQAMKLGALWGAGHATSLFALGLPIVLFKAYLPEPVQAGAETSVGILIVGLALWLLIRWRRGFFHVHLHAHGGRVHTHAHVHGGDGHPHRTARARTPLQAYGIGLVHGIGGTAGVGILLLATIHSHAIAVVALGIFALLTAVSMTVLSAGFGLTLSRSPVQRWLPRLAPALGVASLAFGVWYALGAQGIAPYYF
jgi:ABC-type nickel/cobalt efflux system permease component RcnA